MKTNIIISLFFLCTLAFELCTWQGCKSPTAPKDNNPPDTTKNDTTSHNFIWQIDTLGDGNSSMLNDVAIINDTLVYAVGQIYLMDSTGQFDQTQYNLAKWNGKKWTLNKIFYTYQGSQFIATFRSIFAFSPNDFWVGSNQPMHWNGNTWQEYDLQSSIFNGWIYRIWGSSSSNLYMCGSNGSLAQYNGTWQKIESGTTEDIQDIWGGTDASGTSYALAVASTVYYGGDSKLLRITGTSVENLNTNGLAWSISGIWFSTSHPYYVVGDGMFKKNNLTTDTLWQSFQTGITNYYTNKVKGNAWNDIAVAGEFGTLLHYNGSTWRNFTQQLNLPNVIFNSVAIKGNLIVAVGVLGSSRGIIARGLRIN
jgi:hypothetical protein